MQNEQIIHGYSRRDAIEDGVLVDVTDTAREMGFSCPVAITSGVYDLLDPSEDLVGEGQSLAGRLWDLLWILKTEARRQPGRELRFQILLVTEPGQKPEKRNFWAAAGPGDSGELVITVMLEGEDYPPLHKEQRLSIHRSVISRRFIDTNRRFNEGINIRCATILVDL